MSWKTPQQFNSPPGINTVRQPTQCSNHQLFNGHEFPSLTKQTNLSNTAVLRMLKENETSSTAKKEVVWPPPPEDSDFLEDSQNDYPFDSSSQQSKTNKFQPRVSPKNFEPPPTYIPLRSSAPIQQAAPPVYKSQPVTESYRGGVRMRGDQKWPPPEYKEQIEAENKARIELARGPQFRPPKVQKDYRSFFAKNMIPNTYPGYKAPPGTQHYLSDSD